MGIYTARDAAAVDALVEGHMRTLQELCTSALASDLDSLVLSGSFGRGEGSVLCHDDGRLEPLRDYDVRLIVRRPVPPCTVERVRREFMQLTGLGGADERFSGERGFSLTLEVLTREQFASTFARDRDIRVYDHLHASKVIWGTDHSPALRFPASEIPMVNGLRLLYQKMVGLVGHFATPTAGAEPAPDARRTLLYECDKAFVEICTALVLLAGAYVPSYAARAALFAERWHAWFPELARGLPELGARVGRATTEKLHPGSTAPVDPRDAFAQAREALLAVHRFYVRALYGFTVAPNYRGAARLRAALHAHWFGVVVAQWLGARHLNSPPSRWALNAAYHRLLRYRFARGAGKRGCGAAWESLRAGEAPIVDIYLAAWCALAALRDPPDEALLRCSERVLDRLPGGAARTAAPSGWPRYLSVREHITRAYATWEQHR